MDLRETARRVTNMLIAAVAGSDSTTGGQHRGQFAARAGETKSGIRILTPYGFAMRIVPAGDDDGPESVILAVETNLRYATAPADARYAPDDLQSGEVALYTDEDKAGGFRVHLKRGRVVEILCDQVVVKADTKIRLEAPRVEVTGDLIDHCDTQPHSVADMRTIYDGHTHPTPSGISGVPNQLE